MGTVSPSATSRERTHPAWAEGTSVSTLSVDTSNRGSSVATCSPSFLSQRVTVPSVTVSPSCGIATCSMSTSSGWCRVRHPHFAHVARPMSVTPRIPPPAQPSRGRHVIDTIPPWAITSMDRTNVPMVKGHEMEEGEQ